MQKAGFLMTKKREKNRLKHVIYILLDARTSKLCLSGMKNVLYYRTFLTIYILREINLAFGLNGYAAIALNSSSMLLIAYSLFNKTCKCDCIKFEQKRLLDTRLTSFYVILPFVPTDGLRNAKKVKLLLKCIDLIHKD